jgi:hypothetical protein
MNQNFDDNTVRRVSYVDVGDMPPEEAVAYVNHLMKNIPRDSASDTESVKVLLEAAELQRRKSHDYQNPNSTVKQAEYYPGGVRTIDDIIHAKKLRARSLIESNGTPKFESLEDTYLDMINYCSFAIAYLRGKVPGQDPNRDAFNRPKVVYVPQMTTAPPMPPTVAGLGPATAVAYPGNTYARVIASAVGEAHGTFAKPLNVPLCGTADGQRDTYVPRKKGK